MLPDMVSNPGPLTYESGAMQPGLLEVTSQEQFQNYTQECNTFLLKLFTLI